MNLSKEVLLQGWLTVCCDPEETKATSSVSPQWTRQTIKAENKQAELSIPLI